MIQIITSLFIILLLLVIYYRYYCHDNFSAVGALTQLYSKDNQDTYLIENGQDYTLPTWAGLWGVEGPYSKSPQKKITKELTQYYSPLFGYYKE